MVQIPTFTSEGNPQKTSGVISQIPNISDAATLPYKTLSNQADSIANLGLKFQQQNKNFESQLYKLNKEQEVQEYKINEKYKTDVINTNNKLANDFRILQLRLDRKTLLKSTINNILPELNEIKLTASTNSNTLKAKEEYDTSFKQIIENAKLNIDDKVVKQMFEMEVGDLYATESQQVDSFIRKNSIANAKIVLNTDKEKLFHDYINNPSDRPIILQKLFSLDPKAPGIFMEAAIDGILDVPPQLAVQAAQVELFTIEAEKLVDENPKEFLNLLEQGYWKGKILTTNIPKLKDAAIDKARAMDVDFLTTHMPVDPNMDIDVAEELYKQAIGGDFGGDEIKQSIYQNLDQEGKADFITAINQQRSHVRAEISFQQGQEQRAEIDANNELYTDTYEKIVSGDLAVSDIDALQFEGKLGVEYKTALKNLIAKREEGTLVSDAGLELYDQAFKMIMNGDITSVTDKVIPTNDGPKSIMDITGGEDGIGFSQSKELYSLIINRNNEDVMFQKSAFQDFLNSYKDQILGNPLYQKFNTQSESRFFDFSLIMKQAYEQGIKEGKSPYNLLNSSSDDFILKNIAEFIPSDEQLTDELLQSMGVNVPNDENLPPQKKSGQSVEEWLNSDEYKTWENNQ